MISPNALQSPLRLALALAAALSLSSARAAEPAPPPPPESPNPAASRPSPTVDPSVFASTDPPDPKAEQAYKNALQMLRRGRSYASVIASMEPLVTRHPFEPRYKEALGVARAALALERWTETLPDAAPRRRARPDEGPPPQQLLAQGIQLIEEATRLQPNVPEYFHTLGWIHLANTRAGIDRNVQSSRKRALEAFQSALRLNPGAATYWQALGDLYRLNPDLQNVTASPAKAEPSAAAKAGEKPASDAAKTAPAPLPPGIEAYRRVSTARPRDPGIHFLLYEAHLKRRDANRALESLKLAQRYDRGNAMPLYLLAAYYYDRSDETKGSDSDTDWEAYAVDAVNQANAANGFLPVSYRPGFPPLLAPILRRALGDSLTPGTLELYDRLKSLSQRLIRAGDASQAAGDPAGAEAFYLSSHTLGGRLIGAAMNAQDRYLLHLPELSAGLTVQESALSALRSLYDKYAMMDRLPWMQQQQFDLDRVRQIVSQGAETATPPEDPTPADAPNDDNYRPQRGNPD